MYNILIDLSHEISVYISVFCILEDSSSVDNVLNCTRSLYFSEMNDLSFLYEQDKIRKYSRCEQSDSIAMSFDFDIALIMFVYL